MAEVVGRELGLPARPDARLGTGHDAGVADEEVDAAAGRQEPVGEPRDAVKVAEVELVHVDCP